MENDSSEQAGRLIGIEVALAAFLGGGVGAFLAHRFGARWPIGLLIGSAIGFFLFRPGEVVQQIVRMLHAVARGAKIMLTHNWLTMTSHVLKKLQKPFLLGSKILLVCIWFTGPFFLLGTVAYMLKERLLPHEMLMQEHWFRDIFLQGILCELWAGGLIIVCSAYMCVDRTDGEWQLHRLLKLPEKKNAYLNWLASLFGADLILLLERKQAPDARMRWKNIRLMLQFSFGTVMAPVIASMIFVPLGTLIILDVAFTSLVALARTERIASTLGALIGSMSGWMLSSNATSLYAFFAGGMIGALAGYGLYRVRLVLLAPAPSSATTS